MNQNFAFPINTKGGSVVDPAIEVRVTGRLLNFFRLDWKAGRSW